MSRFLHDSVWQEACRSELAPDSVGLIITNCWPWKMESLLEFFEQKQFLRFGALEMSTYQVDYQKGSLRLVGR